MNGGDDVGQYKLPTDPRHLPRIVQAAPDAVLLVVTDRPDPLTDIAGELAGHEHVCGIGTLIDTLRLRVHIGRQLGVDPAGVDAMVIGEQR